MGENVHVRYLLLEYNITDAGIVTEILTICALTL